MNNIKQLIGKNIVFAEKLKIEGYDDESYLHLVFSDETECWIDSYYGAYSGESLDEYPNYIKVYWESPYIYFGYRDSEDAKLIPVE